eukprot:CAMPEP_0174365720 /NCGR_PEP_ID=MMETSP0811_2-20130205/78247_1 /TAXON_ID=73025 ORGANISM="Eutreptiella gymnastica-like, Strain CCMP1594" /NCGR_SAMPLE_ID=MMETSP0811_2 /ASSEMBLY_ACC=CAM_ASM_000667 /LENGTH=40 /DNA_ID= /DNA_START= /DNA_END= /DNA_ORIENTATION=
MRTAHQTANRPVALLARTQGAPQPGTLQPVLVHAGRWLMR